MVEGGEVDHQSGGCASVPDSVEQYNSPYYQRTADIEARFNYGCTLDERYIAETDFALECAGVELKGDDRILDLACGVGAHADLLSEITGCDVDAFDISTNLIEEAKSREAVKKAQGDVRQSIVFRIGDMANISKEVNEGRQYKLITILGDSFIYLHDESTIRKAFTQYYQLLASGGKLVLQFRGRNFQPEADNKDRWREKLGVQSSDYVTQSAYGEEPQGSTIELMADLNEGDGVFYYMGVQTERPANLPEGVRHYVFGRVYVDKKGLENDLGTAEITDYRSNDQGMDILRRSLAEVGFSDINVRRVPLGESGVDLIGLSAGKPEATEEGDLGKLGLLDFNLESDMDYFHQLEGTDGWIAIGMENCKDQRYFTVHGKNGEKLGFVGVYDTDNEKTLTHIVVDPKYRGMGLTSKFYQALLEKTGLEFLIATISRSNIASVKAHEKAGFKKVSDSAYEEEFDKFKYRFWH